jgi:hypothetical protein
VAVKKKRFRDTLVEHLIQPFDIPFPSRGRVFLSSGFCESDESTTIFRRTVFEGESDVSEVECSLCGKPLITYRHSSLLSSSYSPEIVGCLIQRNKTLLFVVEKSLTQSDLKTVEDVLLGYLAKHDFTALFQKISVYHSGVSSSLLRKQPPKSDLRLTLKLKSISEEIKSLRKEEDAQEQIESREQEEEDKRRREAEAALAGKLLKELAQLSTLPEVELKKINSNLKKTSQSTSKRWREKLSKAEGTLFRKQIRDFVERDSVYD